MSRHRHRYDRFKMVHKNCGHGAGGKVSVVKRKSDGKLLIWKRPKSHSLRYQESYRKEIKKIKLWRKFGLTKVKVCWHPDKRSLLKTYVKGPTLRQMLKKNPSFFSGTAENRPRNALIKFVGLLVDSDHYIHDMKGSNIIFDGKRWQAIDGGKSNKTNHSSVRKEYRKNLLEKWSRRLGSKREINALESFLEKYI